MGEQSSIKKKTKDQHFDSDAEIDTIIAEERKNGGFTSDAETIRNIIRERGKLRKEVDSSREGMKEITTKYGGTCLNGENCVRKNPRILVGERCFYGKGVGLMCLECHDKLEDLGDKDLTKKHFKLRYYERLSKQIKDEIEDRSRQAELLQLPQREADMLQKDKELALTIDEYLRRKIDPTSQGVLTREEEEKLLDRMIATHLEVERKAKDFDLLLEQQLKKKKTRKQIEEVQNVVPQ